MVGRFFLFGFDEEEDMTRRREKLVCWGIDDDEGDSKLH